jgi:hypothetical protein
MNPQRTNSVATLVLAASLAFAAGAAPAHEASVDPRHEMKAQASVVTCSSEAKEESISSSSSAAQNPSSSGSDEAIESKSGNPTGGGGNRPPE